MESQLQGVETLDKTLSSKTVLIQDHPNLRPAIREYFVKTYELYEKLFDIIDDQKAFYIRAEPLRHPLIFYYGHTACAYVNKLLDYGIIKERINPEYEQMFAVGVDEMDWDDLNESHYDWPSVADTKNFKDQVKKVVLDAIDQSLTSRIDTWLSDMWVVLLGIEH